MKKIYLVLLAALGLTFTSCLMEEKELFDKTPAERMDAYLEEYRNILASNEDGWLLQYYADAGGYAYVLKFTKSDVTAYFQLADDVTVPVTTLYKMTPDDGPVLAFDTYNEYLHFFATPNTSDYEALHGDYEFRIIGKNADASEVYVKGRRSGIDLKLVKFSGDPAQYLAACNAIGEAMTAPAYEAVVDATTYSVVKSNNSIQFSYTVGEGEAATSESVAFDYCYTPEGVDFYQPVEIAGQTYSNLVFDAATTTLVSEDGKVTIATIFPPLNKQFVDADWAIDLEGCSDYARTQFEKGFNAIAAKGYPFNVAFIGDYYYGTWGFNVNFGGYGGVLNFTYELIGEDQISMTCAMTGGGNGVTFHNWGLYESLRPLGYGVEKTFTLTADNPKIPTYIVMTDNANPDNVIAVYYW